MNMIQQTEVLEETNNHRLLQHVLPIATLIIIAAIAYGFFYAPILYSDDWSLILGRWYYGNLNWFDVRELRPFLKAPLVVLYSIFGLNIHAFYTVLWILNVVAAVQLYFLMLRLTSRNISIAFAIAALILIYPVDFTHMWLTMIMIRLVVVVTLLYAHLLLVYSDTGRGWILGVALVCLILPFGIYEGQFGVTMAWAIVLALKKRGEGWKKWPYLLLPFGVGVLFLLWRTVGYSAVGIGGDHHYADRVQVTLGVVITRLIMGYRIMVWAWVEPLMQAWVLTEWQAMLVLVLIIALCGFLAYLLGRAVYKLQSRYLTQQEHSDQIRFFMWMLLIGAVFISMGYIPFIAVFTPSLFPLGSRINQFAMMGASVAIVSLFTIIALILKRQQGQINLIVLGIATPLIILGTLIQVQVQQDDRMIWAEQKYIWQELFTLAPDLKDGTVIHFMLFDNMPQPPSLNRNKLRLPLRGSWDVGTGLNMLYGKYSLKGDIAIKEQFLKEGVKGYYSDAVNPYNKVIVVAYDRGSRQLRIIEDLVAENLVDFPVPNYNPYKHIIETPTTQTGFRWLVAIEQ